MNGGDAPLVTTLDDAGLDAAVAAMSRAFWPDPMFGYFARTPLQEHRIVPHFIGAVLRDAHRHGVVETILGRDRVLASASWLRPGEEVRGIARDLRINLHAVRALVRGRNRVIALRLLDRMERLHPRECHWYLALLGVDPVAQRTGLGGALLGHRLDKCDKAVEPAYLETQKKENVSYYERHGFVVRDVVSVRDSPPVWLMWREPR